MVKETDTIFFTKKRIRIKMKRIYITTLFVGSIILTGCGEDGGGSSVKPSIVDSRENSSAETTIKKYKIVAIPASHFSSSKCRGAEGDMIIDDSSISGTVKSGWGQIFEISGTYISSTGSVDGGFADSGSSVAQYSGKIQSNSGNGIWSDNLGCNGTWTTTGLASNTNSSSSPTTTNSSTSSSKNMVNAHDIGGYKISYPEDGLTTVITFGCDGSFNMSTSNHGMNIPIDSGDSIQIRDTTSEKGGVIGLGIVQITLDANNNVLVGESKAVDVLDYDYTIKTITKITECN